MKKKLCIIGIGAGLLALAIHIYDLIFVKFSVKETVLAVPLLFVICLLFVNIRKKHTEE